MMTNGENQQTGTSVPKFVPELTNEIGGLPAAPQPIILYRLFGIRGDLLYVGITDNPERRIAQHRDRAWGHQIKRVTTEWFETRSEARAAEAETIADEAPKYNTAHNAGRKGAPQADRSEEVERRRQRRLGMDLITLHEGAEMLGVSERTLRRRIAEGQLKAYRQGPRAIRVDVDDLKAMLHVVPTAGEWAP